ncbi:trimeric intracellular cation channel family protein [Rhodoferax sediminis]|uniref:Trimeric intracellular cation channel family protein n=1 Tax=Rhodoferax sediminis TaxID=2509614 RepID=A0A515DH68_9BURK|nr:trimeric intracellular cation channel family protein [Rhodoferax sediminis]QDL39763.1 trimeric intracellular cation channel family protein [Rhodoferax sediminis]
MNDHRLFTILDLAGTFAFAISGAVAAKQRNLDLFGIVVIAYSVACGGGIVRDLCIGAIPPAGLANWRYLMVALVAVLVTLGAYSQVQRLNQPVLLFDAVGLGLFAVSGAQKALLYGHNAEVAILLGTTTAVGGGVIRDVLLTRVPVILQREIYASAALAGAVIEVGARTLGWATDWSPWLAMAVCIGLRYLSLQYHWHLPTYADSRIEKEPPVQ